MIYFNHESEIQLDLLCRICHRICIIPISCPFCRSFYCLRCSFEYSNHCISCYNQTQDILYKLDPHTNKLLDKIKCLCQNCNEYISYKKYGSHEINCKLTESDYLYNFRIQIYNSNFEPCLIVKFPCEACKNQLSDPSRCDQYEQFLIRRIDLLRNPKILNYKIEINKNIEISEHQLNLKFACKKCNTFIKYADIQNHQTKCLLNNTGNYIQKHLRKDIQNLDKLKCYIIQNDIYISETIRETKNTFEKYLKRLELIYSEYEIVDQDQGQGQIQDQGLGQGQFEQHR